MNKNIKPTVYKILKEDELARRDDWYLVLKVVEILIPMQYRGGTFIGTLKGMRIKGISFEAITRQRRYFFQDYPELNPKHIKEIREKEELEYHVGV